MTLEEKPYKKIIAKRSVLGLGTMAPEEWFKAGHGSCKINAELGNKCTWINSFIVPDSTYCIYTANCEKDLMDHACKLMPDVPVEITDVCDTLDVTGAYKLTEKCN